MALKKKIWIPIILFASVLLALFAIGVKLLCSYLDRCNTLESGVIISSFTEEDKSLLCSRFDIMAEDEVSIVFIQYANGWRDSYATLRIKVKDQTKLSSVLSNYKVSAKYFDDGKEDPENEGFKMSAQYEHLTDCCMRAFVYKKNDDIEILFNYYEDAYGPFHEYVEKQVDAGNYEKVEH